MDANEFQQDRQLDPNRLDLECAKQADLFFKWAEKSIQAKAVMEQAKFHLDVIEAQLQIECRQNPENFGLVKITEAVVIAAIRIHNKYTDAYNEYLRARETAALLDKAVDTMEQRKRMLESLITLHGQQYFAGPSVPHDLVGAWKEHREKIGQNLNIKQRAKTRKRGERNGKNAE